jgi:transcription antitermination factor NusG
MRVTKMVKDTIINEQTEYKYNEKARIVSGLYKDFYVIIKGYDPKIKKYKCIIVIDQIEKDIQLEQNEIRKVKTLW